LAQGGDFLGGFKSFPAIEFCQVLMCSLFCTDYAGDLRSANDGATVIHHLRYRQGYRHRVAVFAWRRVLEVASSEETMLTASIACFDFSGFKAVFCSGC
jgi:hypothetical protein